METLKELVTAVWPYLLAGTLLLICVTTVLVFIAAIIEESWLAWKRHKARQAEREIEELRRRLSGASYGLESDFQVSVRELQRLADIHRES